MKIARARDCRAFLICRLIELRIALKARSIFFSILTPVEGNAALKQRIFAIDPWLKPPAIVYWCAFQIPIGAPRNIRITCYPDESI